MNTNSDYDTYLYRELNKYLDEQDKGSEEAKDDAERMEEAFWDKADAEYEQQRDEKD